MERLQSDSQELRRVFAAFLASGNPVLALEARLRQTIGAGLPSWIIGQK